MKVILNNKSIELNEGTTIKDLLISLGYSNWVGVWVNGNQILQKDYECYIIKDNDAIRLIRPLGGG